MRVACMVRSGECDTCSKAPSHRGQRGQRGPRGQRAQSAQSAQRAQRAQSMAELAAGLAVAFPVLLCVIDLGYIAMGASSNDSVCREAAAAAASGPPSTTTAPSTHTLNAGQSGYDLAVSVIKVHQPTKLPAQVSEQPTVSEQLNDVPPPEQGGSVDGEISVTTTVLIKPPFLLGAYFGSNGVTLSSKHVAPFTYVVPQVTKSQ